VANGKGVAEHLLDSFMRSMAMELYLIFLIVSTMLSRVTQSVWLTVSAILLSHDGSGSLDNEQQGRVDEKHG
jgi:hypothetical protein